jgi:LmbE family N-acetylglucosaminyl deacetylase
MSRKADTAVFVVAAHPDDEVLGCGGAIARHADRGDRVDVLFVADGVTSRPGGKASLEGRRAAARRAAQVLKVRAPRFLDFPDNRLDSVPLLDIVQALERVIAEVAPTVVYTHHGGDLNIDHRIVHQATLTALRPMPNSKIEGLFAFETPSSTEWATPAIGAGFRPDRFIDISSVLERKLAALEAYGEELRPFPHPRSAEAVRALATWRGASAGLKAAEAFLTLRWIER